MVSVAITHDYITQLGGAERLLLDLAAAFPGAPIHTSVYEPDATYPEFQSLDIRPSWLNRSAMFRRDPRRAFALLAPTFAATKIEADVVLCSSSGWAHAVSTSGRKIVYCHNPARWLYQTDEYLDGVPAPARVGLEPVFSLLRRHDRRAAHSADVYLSNSQVVADRIKAAYDLDARVVHPACGLRAGPEVRPGGLVDTTGDPATANDPAAANDSATNEFVLVVSRLLRYKNVEAVISAVAEMPDLDLVIVGDGPDRARLHDLAAGSATSFLTGVPEDGMRWLYRNCTALVSASHEDFGLTPIEAAGFGRPSVVLRRGGFVESVIEGVTGEFFDTPEPELIRQAIDRMRARSWGEAALAAQAANFSSDVFAGHLRSIVDEVTQ